MGKTDKTLADLMDGLSRVPASDVKRRGWRGVMRTLSVEGAVLVTNHDRPEAVILAADTYANLIHQAKQAEARVESDLALLRRRFDERLAGLRKPDAGPRLRSIVQGPARLRGKVRAGTSY
jgi:PHD/YefM family antitoxin component YafN of YafNO toxin-antitoxin module